MSSSWHEKKEKLRLEEEARAEAAIPEYSDLVKDQTTAAAMGEGEEELFERKMTKEEKKAAAKAAREAKRKKKNKGKNGDNDENKNESANVSDILKSIKDGQHVEHNEAADKLAARGTICTYSMSKKGVDGRSRDINIQNVTLQHKGVLLLDGTQVVLNHGNRYGLIGRNGCGKSTLLEALGARALPFPEGIDLYYLKEEIEASDSITALEAVMSVDEEREKLENEAEKLNSLVAILADTENAESAENEDGMSLEQQQEEVIELLNIVYERLEDLDASTAEMRARTILKGLGFTHEMQSKFTKDFSGGWRMRVSLARALFIQPTLLLLDEPTNHLDMEAVIWLEDYLSKWKRILLMISHSQDFMNSVCTNMIHFKNTSRLEYYDGNYDQFVRTKTEKEENQWKQYKYEQDQIKSMKEFIARFGHGTAKNAKQAQSREKLLEKMVRAGLAEKPEEEKPLNFKFADPGQLPPPVLAFHDVSFAYPNCEPLYDNVNLAIDLDSRIALVGPNGAGKTTLVKLMASELIPTLGDIRPHGHLKLGRFTQHFIDVLNLEQTPLEFFTEKYPNDARELVRGYLGRFGVSGKMQVQKMGELSDGQKSRVVFAKLNRDTPHILLLDEPTNHLDMESIDALATAVNKFEGGMILVSHDMRLISQVAKEIWICDHKTVAKYHGDIDTFKLDMRDQMGIGSKKESLRGDASVAIKDSRKSKKTSSKKAKSKKSESPPLSVAPSIKKEIPIKQEKKSSDALWGSDSEDECTQETESMSSFWTESLHKSLPKAPSKYIPPHLRNKT